MKITSHTICLPCKIFMQPMCHTLSEKKVIIIWSIYIEWDFNIIYIDLMQEITLIFYVAGLLIDLNCLFLSRYKAFNKQCVLHNLNSCSNFRSQSLNNKVIFKVEVHVKDNQKLLTAQAHWMASTILHAVNRRKFDS